MNCDEFSSLSPENALFVGKVMIDLRLFISNLSNYEGKRKVLLFPPLNNFRRFLIHQLSHKENLFTVSIGKLNARRTAVYCFDREDYTSEKNTMSRTPNKSPSIQRRSSDSHMISNAPLAKTKKSRKPDIRIYVPRGRRLLQENTNPQDQLPPQVETLCSGQRYVRNNSTIELETTENWDTEIKENKIANCIGTTRNWTIDNGAQNLNASRTDTKEDRDIEIITNDLCSSKMNAAENWDLESLNTDPRVSSLKLGRPRDTEILTQSSDHDTECSCDIQKNQIVDITSDDDNDNENNSVLLTKTSSQSDSEEARLEHRENVTGPSGSKETTMNDRTTAVPRYSKKNDRVDTSTSSSSKAACLKSSPNNLRTSSGSMKTSECDWEELFDDSGDFVDQGLVDELMKMVGKVRIQNATQDFKSFQTVEERTSDGENIIELYDFPADFKTNDLLDVFASYRADQGFQIVWVDETHALAVFSSPLLADEVLNRELPFVKTRPLKNAILKSRVKARNYVPAPMTRPKTCVSLARRLVSGHLGMKINITEKQREEERKLLSDAREKKRLTAKQKNDVWDDIASN